MNIKIMVLLFLFSNCLSAQTSTYRIHGKSGVPNSKLVISKLAYWWLMPEPIDSINIDAKGRFDKSILLENNHPLMLFHENKRLALLFPMLNNAKNDSVQLQIKFNEVQFKVVDSSSRYYTFFHDYSDKYRSNGGFDSAYYSNVKLDADAYLSWIRNEFKQRKHLVDSFAQKNPMAKSIIHYIDRFNHYEQHTKIYKYCLMHDFYTTHKGQYQSPNNVMQMYLDSLGFNDADSWVPDYGDALKYNCEVYCEEWLKERKLYTQDPFYIEQFASLTMHLRGERLSFAEMLTINEWIRVARTKSDFNVADSLLSEMKKHDSDSKYFHYAKKLVALKNPFLTDLSFSLPDSTRVLFNLNDSNVPIKVLFFWGTWCGPCKKQVPELIKIIDHFANNKGIQFINIGLESNNFDSWKKTITKLQLKGINLYCEGQQGNEDMKKLNLAGGVPKIVILKNGKIIDLNATHPTNGLQSQLEILISN